MLAVYESAPDKFNFSQSWGWKSSTLMLDEGIFGALEGDEVGGVGGIGAGVGTSRPPTGITGQGAQGAREAVERMGGEKEEGEAAAGARARKEGTLRFMVVFGNV